MIAVRGHLLGFGVLGEVRAALGEDVEAYVAAHLSPFVVLFREDGADDADQPGAVGEDADDVGVAADFAGEPFF